ncbi:MAG: hypothetical protein A2W19_10730 [Spirochaetes bacterium RBG_16_49_21]|nr:MAG: hypothetical protein A2W19_10730 [Spirochaetes bacterium RBG_16_49_21]
MEYIDISHKRDYECTIHEASGEEHESCSALNILRDAGYWQSRKSDENKPEYIILDYKDEIVIDHIELSASPSGAATFPRDFRFEASLDGTYWRIIHAEKNLELEGTVYRIDIPLSRIRFLKFFIISSRNNEGSFYSEIGRMCAGISGIQEIRSSSSMAGSGPENLLVEEPGSYWESATKTHPAKETLSIDLGGVYHINRIILGSGPSGFPENFHIETSSDNHIWTLLFEEKNFKAQENKKYFWNTDITPARFIRFEAKGVKCRNGQYGVQVWALEISAASFNPFHIHNIGELTPYASIFQPGITRLAKNGEDAPGTAVQANDRRLQDATTIFKGIVQLAENGDVRDGMAVQASDSRLKQASELKPGIVRLAHDRETKAGAAVQGNDSRLLEAGVDNFGIVKLCPDGMYKHNAAVTGNDPRLQKATEQSYGICKLAPDGGDTQSTAVQAHDKRLREATTNFKGIVELAEDGEASPGVVVQGNDKRLKEATTITKGIVELAEDGEDSPGVAVQGNDRRLGDAAENAKGIVRLAKNGEEKPGAAVQGNDRRLKPATTVTKGIVELAENGENKPGVAVQGSDRRLRDATENHKGIVRLSQNGEEKPGAAVQGNDHRLKPATTISQGIVELAEDGEDSPGVAVQGNDRRLRDATENSKGIVELAVDGEEKAGTAVQGSDRRLRDATTVSKGIVELAEDGEDLPGVAVQGNDRRLRAATTISPGIVELAEDGEDSPGAAVQGNDRRLKPATEDGQGIVMLAKNKESRPGSAVESTDARLADARPPLPHDHEYAPLVHAYGSHEGTISIRASKHETVAEIAPPSDDSAVIHAKNESADSGSIGISGVAGVSTANNIQSYGVFGHGGRIGVRGQSPGYTDGKARGCGILGISRFGAGGVFASEHDYSLYADGYGSLHRYDDSVNLSGNGDALYVNGKSVFNGAIHITKSLESDTRSIPANIVELFEVDDAEYISPGDILVAGESGKSILSRSRTEYNRSAIGVVSGNPAVVINNSGTEKKICPVALAGAVLCRIDARNAPIRPGDLVVTASTPGCGMAGKIDSLEKIGTVVGKSLDFLDDGIGLVPIFITHL